MGRLLVTKTRNGNESSNLFVVDKMMKNVLNTVLMGKREKFRRFIGCQICACDVVSMCKDYLITGRYTFMHVVSTVFVAGYDHHAIILQLLKGFYSEQSCKKCS